MNRFKLYLTFLLTCFFVMSGIGHITDDNVPTDTTVITKSVLSQSVYLADDESYNDFTEYEGNIFSSSSMTHKIRNTRVNIRRKFFGNGYSCLAAQLNNPNHTSFYDGCVYNRYNYLHYDAKDYFISLRKFII